MCSAFTTDLAEALGKFNMWDPDHEKNKWEVLAYARRECPVAHTNGDGGGQYLVTRYEDVRRVLEDPETFSSTGVVPRPSPVSLNPLDVDPPYHTDLRKILNPLFSRNFLMKFEPVIRRSAAELIDAWVDQGRVELVMEYAAPLVGSALAQVVFDERDPEKMSKAIDIVTEVGVTASEESLLNLAVLAGEYIIDREENPVDRNDVLNAITHGTVLDGRRLTEDERLGVITVLMIGGLDTTRGAIASIAHHMTQDPNLEQRLRDPQWVRRDMDEFLRLESPVGCLARTATRDVELGGVQIKAGTQLLLRFDSANRDEARYPNADQLQFDRPKAGHAGFGLGVHRCLGAHFARIQIDFAFDELLKRITNLRLDIRPDEIHWAAGVANGPEQLPLTFDRV